MKTGIVALALVGSAFADYWPAPSSSTAADPVKPSKPAEDCDDDVVSSVAWPVKGAKTSSTSSSATWPKPSWSADPEDCDDEETASWSKKGSWSAKATSSSSVGAWPVKPVKSSSSSAAAKPTWSAAPSYFDPAWGCCKTVVTVTQWGTMGAKPTYSSSSSSSSAAPVWSAPAAPVAPVWSSSSAPAEPVWSAPAEPVWSAPAAPVWSEPAAPVVPSWTSSAAPVASTPAGSYGNITPSGNKWAMTYTPYTTTGQCKTASDVDADLAKIASYGFTTVRLYATDCSGLVNVGASAKAHGLKIIVGVFIDTKGLGAAWSQVDEITSWGSAGNWANVAMIVVGNEAVFNGYCSASDLAAFITKAKGAWSGAGYSGPVTTTEPVNIIQQYASTLCGVVDVAAANIQPFFTSSVTASWAGSFVLGQLAIVEAACGKTAYNLECGWPSAGSSNGDAVPSKSDQQAAITDILAKAGDKTAIFSFEDDAWKDGGSFGVEKSFGCSDLF